MLNGIHWTNGPTVPGNTAVFMLGKFNAVKLLATQRTTHVAEVAEIRAILPSCVFVVRLWDSLWIDPTDPDNEAKKRYPGADELALHWFNQIQVYYRMGIRRFQCDNEPNWLWTRHGYGPDNYAYFMKIVIRGLRARLGQAGMGDTKLIAPPLSWSPRLWRLGRDNPTEYTLDDWRYAYRWHDDYQPTLYSLFDYASAHPYWQYPAQMIDPSFGANFEAVHADSGGMRVWALEYGNSLYDSNPTPPLSEVHAAQMAQYPVWLRWAQQFDYLEGAFLFILGGSWTGFNLEPRIAVAMGKAYERSRYTSNGRPPA